MLYNNHLQVGVAAAVLLSDDGRTTATRARMAGGQVLDGLLGVNGWSCEAGGVLLLAPRRNLAVSVLQAWSATSLSQRGGKSTVKV